MQMHRTGNRTRLFRERSVNAFSLIEVLVALAILGITFVSLYSGVSAGIAMVRLNRENLRATQIMEEKMETIRLYTWNQVTNPGFIPTNFSEAFYRVTNIVNTNIVSNPGITYTGTVSITAAPIGAAAAYASDLRQVTVQLQWVSGKSLRQRDMSTFVSRYGVQNYVYK
jgi:prepilin-type N-terminal cleavage/methylation domain-containing protein